MYPRSSSGLAPKPVPPAEIELEGGYVRWTCCGARFGIDFDKKPIISPPPPGCTILDLTLRITTVTRPSQTDSEQNT